MEFLRNLTRKGLAAACLIGAFAVGSANAATSSPTNPGATATGTVDVSVLVPDVVWIQNLDAVALGYAPGSDATGNEPFCITSSTGGYNITITSLTTAAGNTSLDATGIPGTVIYNVMFDDDADASAGGSLVTTGTALPGITALTGVPPSCAGGDNAASFVTFPEAANLDVAGAGFYADELTLLVTPV